MRSSLKNNLGRLIMVWLQAKKIAAAIPGLFAALTICATVLAQDGSPQLEAQLKTILKVTEVEWVGNTVLSSGTVVNLTKDNLLFETPESQPVVCPATVREGKQDVPSSLCRLTMKGTGNFLQAGQKLYVTKIRANPAKDTVTLDLVNALVDPATGKPAKPTFKTAVNFVFSKGYLSKADAGQIADVINNLLPVDPSNTGAPVQSAQVAAPEPPPPPQAAGAGIVELGMTEDQVKAILGPPAKASQPTGTTTVFVYHKQITFRNGKVSAIE
jgi:hypothetical protein